MQTRFNFHDKQLPELLFRFRARTWPETLSTEEAHQWEQFCRHHLQDADGGGSFTLAECHERIALLRVEREGDVDDQTILDAIQPWKYIFRIMRILSLVVCYGL